MAASNEQLRADYAKVVAKAWSDSDFKTKLLANPAAALAEVGVEVPAGITLKAVENTTNTLYLVIPPPPANDELSEEALDRVVGGGFLCFSAITSCC